MTSISSYDTKNGIRYRVRYTKPDGSQTDKRGFKRKRDAELWASENVITAKARGMYVDPMDSKITIGELGEEYYRKKMLIAKETSKGVIDSIWKTRILPYWGGVRLCDVNRQSVQHWVQLLNDGDPSVTPSGKPLGPVTIRGTFNFLHGIMQDAVTDRRISANPCDGIVLPKRKKRRHTYLTVNELYKLADACGWRRDVILTLGLCGMRCGELIGLTVGDVDLANRRIRIHRAVSRSGHRTIIDTPKNGEPRTIMYPSALDEIMHARCDGRELDMVLFPAKTKGDYTFIRLNSATSRGFWFQKAVEHSGLKKMTLHDLRHTAASIMVSSGANVKAVQRQLGHKTASMTLDTYADLFDDDLDELGAEMDALISRELMGK